MRGFKRFVASLMVVVCAASAGVAAASVLLNNFSEPRSDSAVVPGSQSAEGRADDPRGDLAFGVLVWRNEAGQTCAALGRRVRDRITDPAGLRDYPVQDGGGCVDIDALAGDLDIRRTGEHRLGEGSRYDPVTVVWGLARPGVTEVQVRTTRSIRSAKVSPRGAFVMTFPGADAGSLDVVAVRNGDRQPPTTFPAASAEIRDRMLHPRSAEEVRLEMRQQEAGAAPQPHDER